MKLNELIGQKLRWVQPHAFKLEYELHAGDNVPATLRYPRFFDSFAIAESADGSWTFQKDSFRKRTIAIRAYGAETDLAIFRQNLSMGSGILELPDGRKYLGGSTGFRTHEYDIRTEDGQRVVTYRNIWGLFHVSGETQIYRRTEGLMELPWIVLLGWHLALVV